MKRGVFITIEGIDGSGKSTQAQLLAASITNRYPDQEVLLVREPGGTVLGEEIRQILKNPEIQLSGMAELHLFSACRDAHMKEIIVPALDRGAVVISDRFTDSTVAYQGFLRGVDLNLIEQTQREIVGGYTPDKTFLLQVPAESATQAAAARAEPMGKDRWDFMRLGDTQKVAAGFEHAAESSPERVVVIDGTHDIEEVARDLAEHSTMLLDNKLRVEAAEQRGLVFNASPTSGEASQNERLADVALLYNTKSELLMPPIDERAEYLLQSAATDAEAYGDVLQRMAKHPHLGAKNAVIATLWAPEARTLATKEAWERMNHAVRENALPSALVESADGSATALYQESETTGPEIRTARDLAISNIEDAAPVLGLAARGEDFEPRVLASALGDVERVEALTGAYLDRVVGDAQPETIKLEAAQNTSHHDSARYVVKSYLGMTTSLAPVPPKAALNKDGTYNKDWFDQVYGAAQDSI